MFIKYFLIALTFKIFHNFSHKTLNSTKEEFNIVIVGDIGKSEKKSSIKKNVVTQIKKRHNATPYDLGIVLGDNIYEFGFARDDFTRIKEMFADSFPNDTFKFDFLSLLGNHEYFGDTQTAMKYHQKEPRYYQPDRYYLYTVNLKDTIIQFVCGDSTPLIENWMIKTFDLDDQVQKVNLTDMMEQSEDSHYTFLTVHHNVMAGCGPHNEHSNDNFLNHLTHTYNISAVFSGHNHNMQYFPKNGEWKSHHITVGNSAKISSAGTRQSGEGIWCHDKTGGFGHLKITKTEAFFEFVSENGDVLKNATILPKTHQKKK